MKRIISSVLALGICLIPATVPLMVQPSWGQSQNSQVEELKRLLQLAGQQTQQGQPPQAIQTWQRVLAISRQLKDREEEATALLGIGFNYNNIGQRQQALDYFNQALPIFREINERSGEATTLNNIGEVYRAIGQPQKALEYYNQALPIQREVGDPSGVATTLSNIGAVYDNIGQPQKALEYYNLALPISREVGDRSGEAARLNDIGFVYSAIGQPQKALEYYNQALPIFREVGDRSGEAITLNNIGLVYSAIGQPQKALEYYNLALPIRREVDARSGEATTLNNIGLVYSAIGQPQKALEYFNQALPIVRTVGNRSGEAKTLNSIGAVYNDIGQPQKALEYYNQALPIFRKVGARSGEAITLNNLGLIYHTIGQVQKALEYYNQALLIFKEVGNRSEEATTLNNLGGVYDNIGQPQQALEYYNQALPIRREVGDRSGVATTLNNIAGVYYIGQPQKALEYLNQALPIFREVGDRSGVATTLNNIGEVYGAIGQPQKALEYFNQALPIFREVGNRSGVAMTLNNIGFVYRYTNRPADAITYLEQSTKITLEMRGGLQREHRQKFLELKFKSGTAIALISLLIDQNQPEKAFEWLNLSTTADLADYTRLIKAKVTNPQAQQAIDEWNQKNQQRQFLLQQLQNNFSEQLSRQFRALDEETNRQAEEISRRFPEVAELFETKRTDISQLRASIPAGTVVIQPVLLTNIKNVPNTVAIFVLTKDQLSVIKKPIDPAEFDLLFTQYREQLQNEKDASYIETGGKLYDILIRPVEDKIKAFSPKQLSIIATGKLRYIPFETLYDEQTDQFLIQKYPVNYLTRLSSRSLGSNVETFHETSLQKGILALANPIPRQPQDLPGTEEEVKNIAQLFPGSEYFLRNDATLETFKIQAPRFPFLHLATHGCFQPEGCKKLGMEANTILFADKQFNIADAALLGLQNTQLLTLSACETAMQANSNGEEIAGVAYIFERAGAKGVMASLWNADDEATKELMTQFYQNLKQGMSKGEALQKAKLSQINRHPYFWSPFILIGDAR